MSNVQICDMKCCPTTRSTKSSAKLTKRCLRHPSNTTATITRGSELPVDRVPILFSARLAGKIKHVSRHLRVHSSILHVLRSLRSSRQRRQHLLKLKWIILPARPTSLFMLPPTAPSAKPLSSVIICNPITIGCPRRSCSMNQGITTSFPWRIRCNGRKD